ncbi:CrcB protein [Microbacterium sp. W4I4]|nr:CrcB protein [Microbacterium sp. W4I4]
MARVTQVNPSPPARTILRRAALVALGGMLGTAARLGLGMLIPDAALGVLVANIVGAFVLGVITARLPASDLRVFAGTGVLGGFTTYSAFAVDSVQLWASAPLLSIGYVVVSLVVGIAAAAFGLHLGRKRARA